jgi:hypothetical protein
MATIAIFSLQMQTFRGGTISRPKCSRSCRWHPLKIVLFDVSLPCSGVHPSFCLVNSFVSMGDQFAIVEKKSKPQRDDDSCRRTPMRWGASRAPADPLWSVCRDSHTVILHDHQNINSKFNKLSATCIFAILLNSGFAVDLCHQIQNIDRKSVSF